MGHYFLDIQYDKINFSLTSLKKIKLQFNFKYYFPLFLKAITDFMSIFLYSITYIEPHVTLCARVKEAFFKIKNLT